MPPPDERWFWVLVCGGLILAGNAIPAYLQHLRKMHELPASAIPPSPPATPNQSPTSADDMALKIIALSDSLLQSPNHNIRTAVLKTACHQSLSATNQPRLLAALRSVDPAQRDSALRAVHLLLAHPALPSLRPTIDAFTTSSAFLVALVQALISFLPDHALTPPEPRLPSNSTCRSPLLPFARPVGERVALEILSRVLTPATCWAALDAGIVRDWLAKYPFPCRLLSPPKDGEVVGLLGRRGWSKDDVLMSGVLKTLARQERGMQELKGCGLMERGADGVKMFGTQMEAALASAGGKGWWGGRGGGGARGGEAEARRRRRRRRAVVVNEGGPVTQDHIFHGWGETESEVASEAGRGGVSSEDSDESDESDDSDDSNV